jgi:hypothetical protein
LQLHLQKCKKYLAIIGSQKQHREKAPNKAKANPFGKITPIDKCQLDELAAFMVYNYGLPLGFFDYPAVKAFLYRLRPAYHPSNRNQLYLKLLDQCYKDTKKEVKDNINSQD